MTKKKPVKKTPSKRGRKPSPKTAAKRTEKELLGQTEVVKSFNKTTKQGGRPRKGLNELAEHVKYIIECTAMGYTAPSIVKLLVTKYGENAEQLMSKQGVLDHQKRYMTYVRQRERELRAEVPILSPAARAQYLQDVVDKALVDGIPMSTRTGVLYTHYDLQAAIAAIKEMNAMQKSIDSQTERITDPAVEFENQKEVIREYIATELDKGNKNVPEILAELRRELEEEYAKAIEEVTLEYENV